MKAAAPLGVRWTVAMLVSMAVVWTGCSRPESANQQSKSELAPTVPADTPATPDPTTVAAASDSRKLIVIVGDSISAGYGVARGQSFPADLQRHLDEAKLPWRVVNQGISGDTTSGGANRMASILELTPAIVVIELGGNDGLRGMPLDATRANLEKMIRTFQLAGAKIVLAGMTLPPNYGPDYIGNFEKIYKDLAAKYKATLIPFLLSDMITPDLRYFQPDGIHPTAEGAEIVAGTVMKALQPLLK